MAWSSIGTDPSSLRGELSRQPSSCLLLKILLPGAGLRAVCCTHLLRGQGWCRYWRPRWRRWRAATYQRRCRHRRIRRRRRRMCAASLRSSCPLVMLLAIGSCIPPRNAYGPTRRGEREHWEHTVVRLCAVVGVRSRHLGFLKQRDLGGENHLELLVAHKESVQSCPLTTTSTMVAAWRLGTRRAFPLAPVSPARWIC